MHQDGVRPKLMAQRSSCRRVLRRLPLGPARPALLGPPPLRGWDAVAAVLLAVAGAAVSAGYERLLFLAACALLVLVRRLPIPLTVAIVVLVGLSTHEGDGRYLLGPSLAVLGAAGVLCGRSAPVRWPLALPLVLCLAAPFRLFALTVLLAALAVGAAWRSHVRTEEEQARAEELERLTELQRTEQIGLEERAELARELHDIVGHHVTAVVVLAEAAQARGADDAAAYERIADTARAALSELDTLVTSLREPEARPGTAATSAFADLPDLLSPLRHAGIGTSLHVSVQDPLADGLQLAAFQIVREALTNVMRHASATAVQVTVEQTRNTLDVTVDDDGAGFDPAQATRGRGLVGIGERVRGLRGSWTVDRSPLGGTRLSAHLPVVVSTTPARP